MRSPSAVPLNSALRFLTTVVLLFAAAAAQGSSRPSKAELQGITERGRLLAEYDAAAWQATDALKDAHPAEDRLGHYIARKTEAGWVVAFGRLEDTQEKFLLAYEVVEAGNTAQWDIRAFDPPKEDTTWNLAAARGIQIAVKDFGAASRPYNVAVLPAGPDSLFVYLYPAQVKEGVYPLGADVRYRVSPDGGRIIEKRRMHKSIIEYTPAPPEVTTQAGYHTHVLSDLPEDTDVLLVLTRKPRVPEFVAAGAYLFIIGVNGEILVKDRPR